MVSFDASILFWLLALIFSPLLLGVINRVKAFFGGRHGQRFLQPYFDIIKLLKKGAVYSSTTGKIFRISPVLGLSVVTICVAFVPAGGNASTLSFAGDFIFVAYVLGLMRFFTALAALDTGSAFEGMGASREMQFSILAEVILLACMAVLVAITGELSFSNIYAKLWAPETDALGASVLLASGALFIVLLTENARIPVDDPNTHLELTMIHEVMVLDHSGVDFAFIQYAASLKLWIFSTLLAGLAIPFRTNAPFFDLLMVFAGVFAVAIAVGIVESIMARLKLLRVPQMLIVALALALAAFFWVSV